MEKDITEIKVSISHLNDSISSMTAPIIDALTNENILLKNRVRILESEVSEGQQYQRRNNIVISGIPANVLNENLELQVHILKKVEVLVLSRDVEATHRIGAENKTTIVRFLNRKDTKQAMDAWKKLK